MTDVLETKLEAAAARHTPSYRASTSLSTAAIARAKRSWPRHCIRDRPANMRLALITIACLAVSASAARLPSPFGVPRGGSAVSDYAGLCEAVKGTIVEKAGQSVSGLLFH